MKKAFTLIELLVVISIISLIASVVLASLNIARARGRIGAGKQFEANIYHALADQALGVWDFDECTGSTVTDRAGNGNTGTLMSTASFSSTTTPFATGCSLRLNGTSDYVSLANTSSLSVGSPFTISAWILPSVTAPATWNMILVGGNSDWGFGFNGSSNHIRFTKVAIIDAPDSTLTISKGEWHHVAMVFSNNTVSYYLDGQNDGSGSFAQSYTSNQKQIGGSSAYSAFFAGNIDAVRLYGKDLTASEIGRLYAEESKKAVFARNAR